MVRNSILDITITTKDLDKYDEYYESSSYKDKYKEIEQELSQMKRGKPSSNLKPIRKMTFLIKHSVKMEDLIRLSSVIRERYGLDCFQFSIDRKNSRVFILLNCMTCQGTAYQFNSTQLRKLTVLIVDFLNLPRNSKLDGCVRDFLIEAYLRDNDVFTKQLLQINKIDNRSIDYQVLHDCIKYAELVSKGVVK